MIADLAGLIAPLSIAAFREHLARREPRLFHSDGDVATLLDWDGFIDAALGEDFPAHRLRVTKAARQLPSVFYRPGGRLDRDAITKVLDTGGSLIAYDLHRFVPALARLCASAEAETGEHIVGAAIAGAGEHGALPPHYDDGDLLESPTARRPIRGEPDADGALELALKQLLLERIEQLSLIELREAHRTMELPEGQV